MVTPIADPSLDEFRSLNRRLTNRAGRLGGVPRSDAEDLAQDTWLRLVKETPRPDAPALAQRAFAAFKFAHADYLRKRHRAKEPPLGALNDCHDVTQEDAELRIVELEDLLRHEVGVDALAVARARVQGLTERELGEQPGWSQQRAQAASRRLRRGAARLAQALEDD